MGRHYGDISNRVSPTSSFKSSKKSLPRGLSSIDNLVVRNNLMGISRFMNKKGWVDAQGRQGKGYGVYRFASKYGANVDGYSPIYSPDEWTESGGSFSLGSGGLIAWGLLLALLILLGLFLIITNSKLTD